MPYLHPDRARRMAKRPRLDTQKGKLYQAHWDALPINDVVGTTVKDVQAYVDRVANLTWFRRRYGTKRIIVEFKRGQGGFNPQYSDRIVIGQNATGMHGSTPGAAKRTVLHEMAHTIVGHCEGNWHGPEFARVQLELVTFEFGAEIGQKLRAAYKKNRVKVGSPTPLRTEDKTPAPRALPRTWRVVIQTPSGEVVEYIEAVDLGRALDKIQMRLSHARLAAATDLRVYKSRAPASNKKVATR